MAILRIRDADGNIQEIVALRGEKGDKGQDGNVSFDALTPEQIEMLKVDSTVLHVIVTGSQASHTPAEIKAFVDAGGIAILGHGYLLDSVTENMAYFSRWELSGNNQVLTKSYTITSDGGALYTDYTSPIVTTDKTLTFLDQAADAQIVGERLDELARVIGQGGSTSIFVEDDGNGNVTIGTSGGGEIAFTDDGDGNVTLGVM